MLISFGLVFPQTISGRVADSQANPIPSVRLSLLENGRYVATQVTDEHGGYSFEGLKPGNYVLSIRQLGFRQEQIELRLPAGETLGHDVVLELDSLKEHVVVTATRTESAASLLGSSISVISSQEIEAQNAATVAEVLRNVPGMNIVQVGGTGSISSLFLRGGESDYTKVFLDGIPLNQPGGAIDLSNLSTANIERIEIVRGPQSALYGSDAISGVIQIFTKRGEGGGTTPRTDLFLEGGSYDWGRAGFSLSGDLGGLWYSTAVQHVSTSNEVANDYFRNNTYSLNLGVRTSENSALTFTGRAERGRQGVPGAVAFGPPDLEEFGRKRDFAVGLQWDHRVSDSWQHKLSYSQSYLNQLSADPIDSGSFIPRFGNRQAPFPVFDFVFFSLNSSRRHNVNYQSDFFLADHLLSLGLEVEEERGAVSTTRVDRTNTGVYLQDQVMATSRLAITGGIRLENNESFGFAAIPRVSVAYLARDPGAQSSLGMTRAKLNFGLGVKEPTFVESFSPNFFFQGNPDLKPERTTSVEAGLEQELAQNRIVLEANAFYNVFEDQIAFRVVDPETFEASFFNIARSQAWGIEQILTFRMANDLRASAGYTYLNTRVLRSASPGDPQFSEGARLLRRPTHSGFLGLTWRSGNWSLNSNATLIGNRADSDFHHGLALTEAEPYAKWDMTASYRIRPALELYATVENLLDQDYFEALGFPALGATVRSGLRVHYGE
ncbi:MAG: TonB-dependent receptor [Acidobacteriota bacterium]